MPEATVVLVGTLDTKGQEYAFLRDRIREAGAEVLLVDTGILGEPLVPAEPQAKCLAGTTAAPLFARQARDRGLLGCARFWTIAG